MYRHCRHLLAGSAFPKKEHRSIGGCYFANESEHALHLRAAPEHVFKNVDAQFLLDLPILLFETDHIEATTQNQLEFFQINRLAKKVVGPGANSLHRILLLPLSRDDDDLSMSINFKEVRQRRQPFFGSIRIRR